ncbi:hypothetical protein B0H16DRAFT_267931 [Mycena metata]|uniref:F-box domain-containing protein n=1 Tax=Mycena metata TaxID=1033252 RepID=A0AAD7HSH1_9AGAR|nr:hypothetical protein B0H16DRAFT_267931 [Mycena metata]
MNANHETLPAELWLEIFEHLEERSYSALYTPFQPSDTARDVKSAYSAVVLVCRNWHNWATSFLYRNVKLPDSVSSWATTRPEYGRWVRRMTLLSDSLSPAQIFGICPNITVLDRRQPQRLTFNRNVPSPALSLKRLDWLIYGHDAIGSVDPLWEVLCAAPNLEYLFLSMPRTESYIGCSHDFTKVMHLPSLRTLRIGVANIDLVRCISLWSLPSLTTFIMDSPLIETGVRLVWANHGSHLQTVELANYLLRHDRSIARCLQACPALHELNYHLFVMKGRTPRSQSSVCISVYILKCRGSGHTWSGIFSLSQGCPNLRTLKLYETPKWMSADDRFAVMLKPLIDRGCVLEILDA